MDTKTYTHLVRSLDLAGALIVTPHESLKSAVTEQTHRRDDCQHRQVIVMPVQAETIALPSGAAVEAYRATRGTRKPVAVAHREVVR